MTHALIAEDEPLLAEGLKAELARLWPELTVVACVGDGQSAVSQALLLQPQVCFLDIRMPGMSGLEAAQALVEDWPGDAPDTPEAPEAPFPLLVFVTAYDQYALQAFEVQALDYLVKPITTERLAECVKRLKARLQSIQQAGQYASQRAPLTPSEGGDILAQTMSQLRALLGNAAAPSTVPRLDVIQAQVGATVHLVPVDDVLYFEAADKYVRVVTAEREHLVRASLRELTPQLDAQRFWQVHRATIVQARAIVTAKREESGKVTLTLKGRSEKLVASRLYAHLFKGM